MRGALPLTLACLVLLLAACAPVASNGMAVPEFRLSITADGDTRSVIAEANSTVRDVLTAAGVSLGPLDRVRPSENAFVQDGIVITVTRVTEKFEVVQTELPFERRTVVNSAMPEGTNQLFQGKNGTREDTFRIVFEDGVEVSRSLVRSHVVVEPTPEIMVVGGLETFAPVDLEGTLAFLSLDDAWVARDSTSERRAVTDTHDLDGKVFSLSPDGQWLLYTRRPAEADSSTINTLWLVSTAGSDAQPVRTGIQNVIFAEWSPDDGALTFAYSTGKPSPSPRGYDADNNLVLVTVDSKGKITNRRPVRDSSCGGQSAWWGTNYTWSPDGSELAFAQSNLIGRIVTKTKECLVMLRFTAPDTADGSVWLPGLAWQSGGVYLYGVHHEGAASSGAFDLAAVSTVDGSSIRLAPLAGAYADPALSPLDESPGSDERSFRVAYLQAAEPNNSFNSRYRLVIMDRDGSNSTVVAEPELESPGPARGRVLAWSPDGSQIALIASGNLWIVDASAGTAQQITGDNATAQPRWAR